MVLGSRAKNRNVASVQVDYLVHVHEIKPWPPSHSLRSLKSVLLHWENGDQSSGTTSPVAPSLGSVIGDGKIVFNESFRLPVTLTREISVKGGDSNTFEKNYLEFNLYEPRRDNTVRGQLLGTVIIDLAEYGVLKETVTVNSPMNCKRSFSNTAQPVLYVKIQLLKKESSNTLLREGRSKEVSLDNGKELVSVLTNEEYAVKDEITSFTNGNVLSHSSPTVPSSAFEITRCSTTQREENASDTVMDIIRRRNRIAELPLELEPTKQQVKQGTATFKHLNGDPSRLSSIPLSPEIRSPENIHSFLSALQERNRRSIPRKSVTQSFKSSSSSISYEGTEEEFVSGNCTRNLNQDKLAQEVNEKIVNGRNKIKETSPQFVKENNPNRLIAKVASYDTHLRVKDGLLSSDDDYHVNEEDDGKTLRQKTDCSEEVGSIRAGLMENRNGEKQEEQSQKEKSYFMRAESLHKFSPDAVRNPLASLSDTLPFRRRGFGVKGNSITSDRLRNVKSIQPPLDSPRSNGSVSDTPSMEDVKEIYSLEHARNGARNFRKSERKEATIVRREATHNFSNGKVLQLERRIEKLEGELREAASVEVSLYSIIAEHGGSANKVHAPARRLSRLYLHACKQGSQTRRSSAARSAISGLVLVTKACGNDVPRLTFWLSNSVVLRAIIVQSVGNLQHSDSATRSVEINGGGKGNDRRSFTLKWKESSSIVKEKNLSFTESFDNWEDPHKFITALENIEGWIFSRIVESLWWQTFTPRMHSAPRKSSENIMGTSGKKSYERRPDLGDKKQAEFSLDLWKKAFKDAFERLCPVRAEGHECGCLPVLARLILEQCTARLDVAMFNALLRESTDEIPTDPLSDPISDPKVLPVPVGKSSFSAGAQLKNVIGNWSRWLTDLFSIDYNDSHEHENELDDDGRLGCEKLFKTFHVLNALSDLMMLPKDMLLNGSIRKEVCPTLGAPLIKRVLTNFVPDEFCPDPIPEVVFEMLDTEDPVKDEEKSIRNFPCNAAPIVYLPPSTASLALIIGDGGSESQLRRSGSSVLRKSYASDEELDDLDAHLSDIFRASRTHSWKSKENGVSNAVRYQLLQEVWRDGD